MDGSRVARLESWKKGKCLPSLMLREKELEKWWCWRSRKCTDGWWE